jgi:hypothetical protein
MKIVNWMMMVLLAGGLALTGCGKKPTPMPVSGVDVPKLREAFATASPEIQVAVSEVTMGVRYGDYSRAFAALDKLAKAPNLSEPQKKIVAEVIEQVKQLASKAPAAPPR